MSRRRQVPKETLSRLRFAASVLEDATGTRQVVGRFAERWQADRAAVVAALRAGFSHGQVNETKDGIP